MQKPELLFCKVHTYIILCDCIFETDQKITLVLFRFIGPANTYTIHYPLTTALPGLADWSAFMEQVFMTV